MIEDAKVKEKQRADEEIRKYKERKLNPSENSTNLALENEKKEILRKHEEKMNELRREAEERLDKEKKRIFAEHQKEVQRIERESREQLQTKLSQTQHQTPLLIFISLHC